MISNTPDVVAATGANPQSINGRSYPRAISASSGGCAGNRETEIQWVIGSTKAVWGDAKLTG